MSENIQSISQGTFTIGSTSATNFVAGPGITITEPTAGTVRIGNDETVLWSGTLEQLGSTGQLSEPISRFSRIKFLAKLNRSTNEASEWFEYDTDKTNFGMCGALSNNAGSSAGNGYIGWLMASINGTTLKYTNHYQWMMSYSSFVTPTHTANGSIMEVVGINRKEV